MIPYSQMCNVCNACNAFARCFALLRCLYARFAAVNFHRKVSIFSGKVAKKKMCEGQAGRKPYRGSPSTQQLSEAAKAANRTEIVSPANEQYENRSKLLRYHNKQEPLRIQRSGEAEYKWQHRIQ